MNIFISPLWTTSYLLAEVTNGEAYTKAVVASLMVTAGTIFLLSVLLGELCVRLSLPTVLGDLATGVIMGGSILSILVFSEVGEQANSTMLQFLEWVTQADPETTLAAYQFQMRAFINESANIGLLTLLFVTGLESDLAELIQVGTQAATVAVTGVVLPLVIGAITLSALFDVPTIPALFAGAALTATSIGITAKVLQDLGRLQSSEGQIILGAAILDDILGIVVLAIALSLVETGEIEITKIISLLISATIFVLVAILLNRYFCPVFTPIVERFKNPAALMLFSLIFLHILALTAIGIGLEALLGAFAAGLVLGGMSIKERLAQLFEPFVYVYTTVFFVTIGARVDLSVLNPFVAENRESLIIAACLITIAVIGKIGAGFVTFTDKPINRLAIGVGMIPRGEVGLVFAGLGAATGVLSESLDVAVIIMVIVTTLIAPFLLRLVFRSSIEKIEESRKVEAIQELAGEKF
ncbi:MAG: cation:proton antiporter [Pleurocapsa sp. MO_192.B19]|nr:cation:proton antiporter [Pleurocapsa sp. MO_192.B19]